MKTISAVNVCTINVLELFKLQIVRTSLNWAGSVEVESQRASQSSSVMCHYSTYSSNIAEDGFQPTFANVLLLFVLFPLSEKSSLAGSTCFSRECLDYQNFATPQAIRKTLEISAILFCFHVGSPLHCAVATASIRNASHQRAGYCTDVGRGIYCATDEI